MQTSIAVVGISGYGALYVRELLQAGSEREVRVVAGIDPSPRPSVLLDEFTRAGIPLYPDLTTFYQNDHADLVVISAPIQFHGPMTCQALAMGSHVLCEKPLAGSIEDAQAMLAAQLAAGKMVGIGYQWSFSDAVQALKRDILSGRLGKPLRFKTATLWGRSQAYYKRNDWAGRIKALDGAWVLDSPVNNATAHYLHNMLYVLGDTLESSAAPLTLQAELYRANPIENYDTAALRVKTKSEVDLLFLTAHPVQGETAPLIHYEFEDAEVVYPVGQREFEVRFHNGMVERCGSPDANDMTKLWKMVEAVRTGGKVICGIQAALPHLVCTLGAQAAGINNFPPALIRETQSVRLADGGDMLTWVEGLAEVLMEGYQSWRLPSEIAAASGWAVPATQVDLGKYAALLAE